MAVDRSHSSTVHGGTASRWIDEIIKEEAVCEYNFKTAAYLESMGVPALIRTPLAAMRSGLIDHGLFFRNNARIFCRKSSERDSTHRP